MKGQTHYQSEIDAFCKAFGSIKDKRIVLYGIGRRTATLVPALKEIYLFVGLMDRDEGNIGKIMFDLPVVTMSEAETIADMIIINAPQAYWQTIYKRLTKASIPVYFTDGSLACVREEKQVEDENPYWNKTEESLRQIIKDYDVISFDLYDTLIMRKTYLPQDVWKIMEKKLTGKYPDMDFLQLRKISISKQTAETPSISEIYKALQTETQLTDVEVAELEDMEKELEKDLAVSRSVMADLLLYAQKLEKQVYIISDMHLPAPVIKKILNKCGISVEPENIWISCEKRLKKSDGGIWKSLSDQIFRGKKVLHIGDNREGDVTMPTRFGIDTYHIMSANDMLNASALKELEPQICSEYAAIMTGIIMTHICNNPFALSSSKGKFLFNDAWELGYCLFGPVIYTFLMWIDKTASAQSVEELLFFARDGYFLHENYRYLCALKGSGIPSAYLEVSRRGVMTPTVTDINSLAQVAKFPYNGLFSEFLEDRFAVNTDERTQEFNDKFVSTVNDSELVFSLCERYMNEILEEAEKERKCYLKYIDWLDMSEKAACVDSFFYGNTQYYLSKLLQKNMTGYYIACDLSENNLASRANNMMPCFQLKEDVQALDCHILKNCLLLESYLTAPNGMFIKMNEDGEPVYGRKGGNQKYFDVRIRINEGVQAYIKEMFTACQDKVALDTQFVDRYYGEMVEKAMILGEDVKNYFYFDNELIQRREMKIYE